MVVHSAPNAGLPLPLTIGLVLIALIVDIRVAMYFLDDLYKPERRVSGGDKSVWAVLIVVGSVLGMLAYVLFGREN